MSEMQKETDNASSNGRSSRWQFRKRKKIEKRRKQRQEAAIARRSMRQIDKQQEDPQKLLAEKQKYELAKKQWEEREEKFKLLELAKAEAKAKEERAKAIAKKKWQEMLLNLPILPTTTFQSTATADETSKSSPNTTTKKPIFKKFVESSDGQVNGVSSKNASRKTYRERFQERKKTTMKKQ